MLASARGLEISARGGVLADTSLRTSDPRIFAAGDICEYVSVVHGGDPLRTEHWDVVEQARSHGSSRDARRGRRP